LSKKDELIVISNKYLEEIMENGNMKEAKS